MIHVQGQQELDTCCKSSRSPTAATSRWPRMTMAAAAPTPCSSSRRRQAGDYVVRVIGVRPAGARPYRLRISR
jgi:hypothetical protein